MYKVSTNLILFQENHGARNDNSSSSPSPSPCSRVAHCVVIHPCPSTSCIETRTAMRIAAHGLCVCRCILYYSFYSTTAHRCHPFHPLYYSERLWAHVSLVS